MAIVEANPGRRRLGAAEMAQELARIAEVFREMEFNEALYRRKYAILSSKPIKLLFDEDTVRAAAARALEDRGGNFAAVRQHGYNAIVREVFRLKNCTETAMVAPSALVERKQPESHCPPTRSSRPRKRKEPLASSSKQSKPRREDPLPKHPVASRDAARDTVDGGAASTSGKDADGGGDGDDDIEALLRELDRLPPEFDELHDFGNIASTSGQDQASNGDDFPDLPPGFEDFRSESAAPLLLPAPVPVPAAPRRDYDWRIGVEGCRSSEMMGILDSRLEIVPAALGDLVILPDDDGDRVLKFVTGAAAELFYQACASNPLVLDGKEIPVERFYSPTEIPSVEISSTTTTTTIVYFRGDRKGWSEEMIKQQLSKVVPEDGVGEIVRSVHLFPEGRDAIVELGSGIVADLIFYRWIKKRECDASICRRRAETEAREDLVDIVSIIPDLNVPIETGLEIVPVVESGLEIVPVFESGLDIVPLRCEFADKIDEIQQPGSKITTTTPLEIAVRRETGDQTKRRSDRSSDPTNRLRKPVRVKIRDEPSKDRDRDRDRDREQSPPRPLQIVERNRFKDVGYSGGRLRDTPPELKLLLWGDIFGIEDFLERLLSDRKPGERCKVFTLASGKAIVRCSSGAAADAIMDAYIEDLEKFVGVDGGAMELHRDGRYSRPGQVNKQSFVPDEEPSKIRVSGMPDLPVPMLKAAMTEVLDREFATNSAVREHGAGLFKFFEKGLMSFYTAGATEALLELKSSVRVAGERLRFRKTDWDGSHDKELRERRHGEDTGIWNGHRERQVQEQQQRDEHREKQIQQQQQQRYGGISKNLIRHHHHHQLKDHGDDVGRNRFVPVETLQRREPSHDRSSHDRSSHDPSSHDRSSHERSSRYDRPYDESWRRYN